MDKRDIKQVAIIDYEMGNLFSVSRACETVGLNPVVTFDKSVLMKSSAAILPGVGAFADAMENLRRLDLVNPIVDFIETGRPFMGICLGMQLLCTESEEFGIHRGLNLIEGRVTKFPSVDSAGQRVKVPQVGWNQIFPPGTPGKEHWAGSPLENLRIGEFMYFVHSYCVIPVESYVVLSQTEYGGKLFCSSIHSKNIFACQFHPEKSAIQGIKIYEHFKITADKEAIHG